MPTFHPIDLAIVAAYVVATIGVGFWIARRASQDLRGYFLGGNRIPWWCLGVSNASGMFDISGTMLMVCWMYVYGVKSVWIPWLWPVFNQVLLMVYLSVWLRRSGVLTGADWIRFRFGDGRGAQLAHLVVVVFALVNTVGFLAYGFVGIGKFAHTFVPPAMRFSADPVINANLWGLAITAATTLYVVKGGMVSVVFTELLQFAIMTVACVGVGVIAMRMVSPEAIDAVVPPGWRDLSFGWRLGLDWTGRLDAADARIASDGWELFSLFVGMALFKGVLSSMAGPAPNYDMQRVLSTRSPREAALMSGVVSLVLLVPRYMLITGLAALAVAFFTDDLRGMGDAVDFELILPLAMREFIPVGLFGLLIAALLAAFMSTYAATVNAAPAYVVNDIYKRYLRPDADDATYVRMSYLTSVVTVVVGTGVGFLVDDLKGVVNWIVAALYGAYIGANLLKWHWWRFNGWGYFWGMTAGMVPALVAAVALDGVDTLWGFEKNMAVFPAVLALSLFGCVAGSLLTPADDPAVLREFYLRVRPWGWWGPVYRDLLREHPAVAPNRGFPRDAINVAVGIVWQTAITTVGVYLVLRDWWGLGLSLLVVAATSVALKLNWYDRLEDYPRGYAPRAAGDR